MRASKQENQDIYSDFQQIQDTDSGIIPELAPWWARGSFFVLSVVLFIGKESSPSEFSAKGSFLFTAFSPTLEHPAFLTVFPRLSFPCLWSLLSLSACRYISYFWTVIISSCLDSSSTKRNFTFFSFSCDIHDFVGTSFSPLCRCEDIDRVPGVCGKDSEWYCSQGKSYGLHSVKISVVGSDLSKEKELEC